MSLWLTCQISYMAQMQNTSKGIMVDLKTQHLQQSDSKLYPYSRSTEGAKISFSKNTTSATSYECP